MDCQQHKYVQWSIGNNRKLKEILTADGAAANTLSGQRQVAEASNINIFCEYIW